MDTSWPQRETNYMHQKPASQDWYFDDYRTLENHGAHIFSPTQPYFRQVHASHHQAIKGRINWTILWQINGTVKKLWSWKTRRYSNQRPLYCQHAWPWNSVRAFKRNCGTSSSIKFSHQYGTRTADSIKKILAINLPCMLTQ